MNKMHSHHSQIQAASDRDQALKAREHAVSAMAGDQHIVSRPHRDYSPIYNMSLDAMMSYPAFKHANFKREYIREEIDLDVCIIICTHSLTHSLTCQAYLPYPELRPLTDILAEWPPDSVSEW